MPDVSTNQTSLTPPAPDPITTSIIDAATPACSLCGSRETYKTGSMSWCSHCNVHF